MIEGEFDDKDHQAVTDILNGCEAKVSELKEIFVLLLPAEGAGRWIRGWKAISSLGQDHKVESIERALMNYINVLNLYHSSRTLSTAQFTQALSSMTVAGENRLTKPVFMVRYEKEEHFIGREQIMRDISDRFTQKAPRVVLSGIGGVGYAFMKLRP